MDNASSTGSTGNNVNPNVNSNANASPSTNSNANNTSSGATPNSSANPRPFDARSPTQSNLHPHPPPPPFSPTNGHPRPQFNNPYHPPTPAPLPMPAPSHISGPPASPHGVTAPQPYASEYPSAPRDKPTSSYYDPTSDSGERRPSESNASWHDPQARTPQVWTRSRPLERSLRSTANIYHRTESPTTHILRRLTLQSSTTAPTPPP